jgi:hypothetical protein
MTITHYGVTWTLFGNPQSGVFANGEPWVVGPITVTDISPKPSDVNPATHPVDYGSHGSMINPTADTGYNVTHGLDARAYNPVGGPYYDPALNLALSFPFVVGADNSLCSSIGYDGVQYPYRHLPQYAGYGGYPYLLKTVCVLTVLAVAPPTGSFRPHFFGNTHPVLFNLNDVDFDIPPSYPSTPNTPSRAYVESLLPALPWFEMYGGWDGLRVHPWFNTASPPGGDGVPSTYGREIALKWSIIALWLSTDASAADKRDLLIRTIQCGLDIAGFLQQGAVFLEDGGHKCGRKWPLFVAAVMLNDPTLLALAGDPSLFQEDRQTFVVEGARVVDHAAPGESWYGREFLDYRAEDAGVAEWGIRHARAPFEDNRSWTATYRDVVWPAMVGASLAANLWGREAVWNHPAIFLYNERFVSIAGAGSAFAAEMYTYHDTAPPLVLPAPTLSLPAGIYESSRTVTVTGYVGSEFYYTTNGATPTTASTHYTGPITLPGSCTLKVIAAHLDFTAQPLTAVVYTIDTSGAPSPPHFTVTAL